MTGLSIIVVVGAWIGLAYWWDKRALERQFADYRRRDQGS
jgi:hypothetical protein